MKKKLYLLSDKIEWRAFKLLNDKLVRDSGPTPKNGDRMLWKLLREKRMLCWFAEDMPDDMGIGSKLPERYKTWEIKILQNNEKDNKNRSHK